MCLTLPEAVRSGLALWLDPSNLGPVGSHVSTWCDQSGNMNDALAINPDALPQVSLAGLTLAYGMSNAAFLVHNNSTIDLGAGDFLILVVAGITHVTEGHGLFNKSNGDFVFPKGVTLDWEINGVNDFRVTGQINETVTASTIGTAPGPERLYGLRRVSDHVELRINDQIVNTATALATPGASTLNAADVYLGQYGDFDQASVDSLHAVVVVRGQLSSGDVAALETYLMQAFGL
jgi:hypothetical protein